MVKGSFIVGALIGGAAAYTAAYLYAPKSGRELQEELVGKAETAKEVALDYLEIAAEKSKDLKAVAQDASKEIKDSVKETSDQLAAQIKMDAQILKDSLSDVRAGIPGSKERLKANLEEAAIETKYAASMLKEDIGDSARDAKLYYDAIMEEARNEVEEAQEEHGNAKIEKEFLDQL